MRSNELGWMSANVLVCLGMSAVRYGVFGRAEMAFLPYNLVLALLPLGLTLGLSRRRSLILALPLLGLWLLFLPNAPYLLTDLVHFRVRAGVPGWFDLAMLVQYSLTGLLLGFLSMDRVEAWLADRGGPALAVAVAWTSVVAVAFGIYLGRVERWNSWDVARHPDRIVGDLLALRSDPEMIAFVIVHTALLGCAYGLWRSRRDPAPVSCLGTSNIRTG